MKKPWGVVSFVVVLALAAMAGHWLATRQEAVSTETSQETVAIKPAPIEKPASSPETSEPAPEVKVSVTSLINDWQQAKSFEERDRAAAGLAEISTAESVKALMDGIMRTTEWSERAALAKNLRAVSDPETLAVLVPALLENYGRGSTILGEIVDAIARLAQPETIEDLAALHWQASTQAGQGHKVLRAVAAIRNPAARRGLERLVARSDSPALSAAAQEAIQVMQEKEAGQATEQ